MSSSRPNRRRGKQRQIAVNRDRLYDLPRRLRLEELEPRLLLSVANASINQAEEDILVNGLSGLADWADTLDNHSLVSQLLPTLGQSVGDTLDLGDLLSQGLAQPVAAYFTGDPTDPTTDELVTAIGNLNGAMFDNVTLTLTNVSGGKSTVPGANELIFNLEFQADRSISTNPSLGPEGDALGIDFSSSINADATLTFDFSFGVDQTNGLTDEQAFFIRVNSLDTEVDANIAAVTTGPMSIGFFDATLTSGNLTLDADLAVAFNNPDSDPNGNLTLAELQGTSLSSLVASLTESGTASGSVTVTPGTFGSFSPGGTPTISFNSVNPFIAPSLSFNAAYDALQPFTNVSSFSFVGVLEQLAVWMDELEVSSLLEESIQLTSQQGFGDLTDLSGIVIDGLIAKIVDMDGVPLFDSAQSLATELETALGLSAVTIDAEFDPLTKELTYHLIVDHTSASSSVPVGIDLDLSPVAGFTSASNITVDTDGTLDFTLGVTLDDLQAVMVATTTAPANGQISTDSNFDLNLGFGTPVAVTLTQVSTTDNVDRNDLVIDFNAALATAGLSGSVVAALDASNRLTLTTTTPALGLAALELTAADYNPQGPASVDPIAVELGFREHHFAFDSLVNHAFLEDATIDASVTLTATDIDASANVGFLDVSIVDGAGIATADVSLAIKDPVSQTVGGRVGLFSMFDSLATNPTGLIDTPTLTGALNVTLPIEASLLGVPLVTSPELVITWADITTGSPNVQLNDGSQLLPFENLAGGDVSGALTDLVDYLTSLETSSFLGEKIPGLSKSLGDMAEYADRFAEFAIAYEAAPAATLDQLEAVLEDAFGLDANDLDLSLVESGNVLRADLTIAEEYVDQIPVAVGIDSISAGGIGTLEYFIDLKGSALVNLDFDVDFQLSFGIDMSTPGSLIPFIYESTHLTLGAKINAQNVEFQASIGPLGLFAKNGLFLVDADGNEQTQDQAMLQIDIDDNNAGTTEGKIPLTGLSLSNASMGFTGQVHLVLPLFYPFASDFIGNLELTITDVGDILNTTTLTIPDLKEEEQKAEDKPGGIVSSLTSVLAGLDTYLQYTIDALNGKIGSFDLPFVGKDLNKMADFIEEVRDDIISQITDRFAETEGNTGAALQTAIFLAVGPDGLGILKDRDGSGMVTLDDIEFTSDDLDMDGNLDQVEFFLDLEQNLELLTTEFEFDIGLPGLGLEAEGDMDILVGYEWGLAFGLSDKYGFYVLTNESDEISIDFEVRIPDLTGQGELAFLQIDIADEDADNNPNNDNVDVDMDGRLPSSFTAGLTIDILDPKNDPLDPLDDYKLTQKDIKEIFTGDIDLSTIVDIDLVGAAELNLDLLVSFEGDSRFPSIGTEFTVDWVFAGSTSGQDLEGAIPTVSFTNVTLNAGAFITDFVDDILKNVKEFTEPVQPVVDFITSPIPILSDFGFDFTPLDVAEALGYASEAEYVEAIADIVSAVNSVPTITGDLIIPIGDFVIVEPDGGGGTQPADLRDPDGMAAASPEVTMVIDPVTELKNADASAGSYFDQLHDMGIYLPMLESPTTVFQLLMGQEVDLFLYDVPELALNFPFPIIKIGPLIPPIPLFASFGGTIGAELDLAVGFDTHGVTKFKETGDWYDVFSGFYISDTENPDGTGEDVPEATLTGNLNAALEISLVVVGAGVSGGVDLNLYADLVDPNGDGKVHIDELIANIPLGVTGTFDLSGDLTARLDAYVEFLFQRHNFTIAEFELSSFEFTDEDIFTDRFSGNDTMGSATFIGAGPGLHVDGLSIESVADVDWYSFEILKTDSIEVDIRHSNIHGNIDLEVYNSLGLKLGEGKSELDRDVVLLEELAAGTYFVRVSGDGGLNNYQLAVEPGGTSQTRVIYVNPAGADDRSVSYHTLGPGSDVHEGLSHRKPKASLQSVLDSYDLGANDVVVFDTGTYVPGGSILTVDSGATYIGSIGSSVLSGIELQNSDANTFYRLDIVSASPGLTMYGSDNNVFDLINFSGSGVNVSIDDSDFNLFDRSTFAGTGDGLKILGDSSDDSVGNIISRSVFQNELTSLQIDSYEVNVVDQNTFTGSGQIGIRLPLNVPAVVTANTIGGRATGISWDSRVATVADNDIDGNTVGIRTIVGVIGADNPVPYGTPGGSTPNRVSNNETGILVPEDAIGVIVRHTDIFDNEVGIEAHGDQTQILSNDIHDNELGIRSSRVIGPTAWEANQHNLIRSNTTGVEALAGAEVRYNRVSLNDVGIEVLGSSLIHHNIVYRNTSSGILLDGADNVEIVNNTLYVTSGDGFHLKGFVKEILIHNNIVMAAGGFGLYVEAESQFGYTSDYNNYFATSGGVAFQGKGFGDLYDWQVEAESDLHSLGSTVLDPTLDDPLFVDLAGDDYHTSSGATSIDAGDPTTDFSLEPTNDGNRVNLGAYGNTPQATTSPAQRLEITEPNFYVDLVPSRTYDLKWESNNLGAVDLDIDLIQVGVGKVGDIATVAASAGMTTWSPGSFVTGNNTNRYQVRLTTLSGPAIIEESREPFSIPLFNPASSNTFYVNDSSTANDEYTTAVGNNRNTGLTADTPKVVMRPLVLSYSMGAGDEVRIDTGNYVHAINLNLSSAPVTFDPRMQTVSDTLITGPTNLGKVAHIDRANPNVGSAAIDAINSPNMTLDNLTIVGAGIGVRFREGSENLVASDLILSDHGIDGLSVETDSHYATLDRLTVFNNGRNGIFVDSRLTHLKDSEVYNNTEIGIALRSIGAGIVETSEVYNNFRGIDVINSGPDQAVIGHLNWAASLGNLVHHNSEDGIFASGNTAILTNSVYENINIGIRLEDSAAALFNVVRQHTTGISAKDSSSIIFKNRSFINSVTGIEASLDSDVLQNVTYSNGLHGIHATKFSGVIDHNLVYSTGNTPGNASMNIEGPGTEAQVTFNTVYEPCSSNEGFPVPTVVTTEWDPQIFMEQLFPPGPPAFPVQLWGNIAIEFQDAMGDLGGVFYLGPGGGNGALLSEPLPEGEIWTIDYEIVDMELSSAMFPPTPMGIVEATLSGGDASTGQMVLENQGGVLVGFNTMNLNFEFSFPEFGMTLTPVEGPLVVNTTIDFSSGWGEYDVLQIPTSIPLMAPGPEVQLLNLANGDEWRWEMEQADVSGDPDPPPPHRGDTCAEVGVIVQTQSERVYLRNNAIYVEGDASLGTTVGNSIDLIVTGDSTMRWDSDFNALITDYGAVGEWAGLAAPTLPVWQGLSNDDFHSIDPPVGTIWVDVDGNDNQLAGFFGDDDNFHLLSPFGQVTQGTLAPIEDVGVTNLPIFLPVITQTNPAGTVNDLSPLVDAGDPASSFSSETFENGDFANIGHYGNTSQASNSEPEFVHLVYPIGIEQIVPGRTYDIEWRSHDLMPLDTVEIELVHDGIGGLVETTIDPAASNTGLYSWTVPGGLTFDTDYRIVIRRPSILQPGINIEGETPFDFELDFDSRPPIVLDTTPHIVELDSRTLANVSLISIDFSENLSAGGAGSSASYELKDAGPDGIFDDSGTSDDIIYTLNVTYNVGASDADTSSVDLAIVGGPLPEADYRLTVYSSGISDPAGLNLDGTLDGGTNDYVRFFTIDQTEPTFFIPVILPDPRNDGVTPLSLEFDEEVTGVGLADVRLTRDGGPNLLSGTQAFSTADGIVWLLSDTTDLTSTEGIYTFELTAADSNIFDIAGNPLTLDMAETWEVDTTPPTADIVDVSPDPRSTAVDQITIVFSEEVVSFGLSDLRLFRDEVEIGLGGSQIPTTSDNLTWTVDNLAALTAAKGSYLFKVQTGGTLVDGVGNGLLAETRDVWQVLTSAPEVDILDINPDPRIDNVDEVVLSFNVPISGLDLTDLELTLDTVPVSLAGLAEPTSLDQMNWHLTGLSALTTANGTYELTLTAGGSSIADLASNALVFDASESWVRDDVPPTVAITAVAPNLTNTAVDQMSLVFSKLVTGVDLSNLVLTRDALLVPWTGIQTVTTSDGITWALNNLDELTSVDGDYELTLSPGVDDIQSFPDNPLLVGDSETWTQDFTVPTLSITEVEPDFVGNDFLDIVFSEVVSYFDIADLVLTRGGLVVPLTASQTLTTSDNQTYTLGNLLGLTNIPGKYELSLPAIGSGIDDAAGNLLPVGNYRTWEVLLKLDLDEDHDVDGFDFLKWQINFGLTGADPIDGDSTGDGLVGDADRLDWEAGFGTAIPFAPQVDSFDGAGAANFAALEAAHDTFIGTPDNSLTFTGISGVITPTQFTVSHGITFFNLGLLGGATEGDPLLVENLDGYDGTYQPDGDTVYGNYPNHLQPLTFEFDTPVARVGSFVAIGIQGAIDTLTITAFDTDGAILKSLSIAAQLFADGQNREALWAFSADAAAIAKVTILNDNPLDFGNTLIIDTLEWSTTPSVGSPAVLSSAAYGESDPVVASASLQFDSVSLPRAVPHFSAADIPFWLLGANTTQGARQIESPRVYPTKRDQQDRLSAVDVLFEDQQLLFDVPVERVEQTRLGQLKTELRTDVRSLHDQALVALLDGELDSEDLFGFDGS